MKSFKHMFQFLNNANYLMANSVRSENKKIHYKISLLKNGLIMREELAKQWRNATTSWAIQKGEIIRNQYPLNESSRLSFLHNDNFRESLKLIYKYIETNPPNPILLKTISGNICSFIDEDNIFNCFDKTLLISEYFVPAENGLARYYNLQRERKIWWMLFSANASRYVIEPFDLSLKNTEDILYEKIKSITIKANFGFGLVDIENITLIPLWELSALNMPCNKNNLKMFLIRSVINLDLTTCALILDACESIAQNGNHTMMLNRKLAPYQVLVASMHEGNKIVNELTLHLEHVIAKNGLRLYDKSVHINSESELEENILHFDNLGVPYILVVDNDSIKTGLIRIRSRDTTLFETIHVSDIPNYILHIFKP